MPFLRNQLCPLMLALALLLGMLSQQRPALAADGPVIPNFWDPQERFIRPNLKSLPRLKFLTTTDFPPFSYVDQDKRLAGFHIDLARAICSELEVLKVCQIQALPFDELRTALAAGNGDAIIAGLSVTATTRQEFEFSRTYFRLPARFVASKKAGLEEPLITSLAGQRVGVIAGTAHAAFGEDHFGDMQLQLFPGRDEMLTALEAGSISAAFDDGLALSFWLRGKKGAECCSFAGGPYLSEAHFGHGLAVAITKGNRELTDGIDYALRSINDKGIFAELYLRYFPISLY